MQISPNQIRAARALLDWSQAQLASKVGLSAVTINSIEGEKSKISTDAASRIYEAFSRAGVLFFGESGLSLNEPFIKVLDGKTRFQEFYDDVLDSLKINHGTVRIYGVDELMFRNALGDKPTDDYIAKISELPNLDFKVISAEKYIDTKVKYAKYKLINELYFTSTSIYLYLDRAAFILWKDSKIILLKNSELNYALSKQFDFIWEALPE